MEVSSKPNKEKDFSMLLSELGEPDEGFAAWWARARLWPRHGRGAGEPGGFAKWTVQEPTGPRLSMNDIERWHSISDYEVEVHFTGKMLDGTVFASSRENEAPLTLTLTRENVMKGFCLAIGSMNPGERAVFTIPTELTVTESGHTASIPWNIPLNQTLWFDIELISLVTDILDDQGIQKKIIKFGRGYERPHDSDEVFVDYSAYLEDGTSVSKSNGVEFSLLEGFFCPAIAHAVTSMAEGEEAILIIKPEYGFGDQGRPANGNEAAVLPGATLYVTLKLIYWKHVSRIGQNGDILKRSFCRRPRNQKPYNQAVVKVRLTGKLLDGTVFDRRGHDGQAPFEFTIDEEHVIEGLDEAVLTMAEGEVASFTIPPQYAFGNVESNQYHPVVPPNSVVEYEVELLSVVNEKYSIKMTRVEIIEYTRKKQKEGDELFTSGKYLRAYRRYYVAMHLLTNVCDSARPDGEIKEMLVLLAFKTAECAAQLQDYKEASRCYIEVLKHDPENSTAKQMLEQSFPRPCLTINKLRFQFLGPLAGAEFLFARRKLKHGHKCSRQMITVPQLATANQVLSAGQSPAAPAAPGVGGSSSSNAVMPSRIQSFTTGKLKRLISCFGSSSSGVNANHGP